MIGKFILWLKEFLIRNMLRCVFIFLIVASLLGTYLVWSGAMPAMSDRIKYVGFVLTVFSLGLAMVQIRLNQAWNKKQLAITISRETKKDIIQDVYVLDEAFGFIQLSSSEVIPVDDIHKKICLVDENKNLIVGQDKRFKIDNNPKAQAIKKAIHKVLNTYEYLATGIYQGVFDREIIQVLRHGEFIKTYKNFSDYIVHMNKEMRPDWNNSIWINFKALAEEFRIEQEEQFAKHNKRKEADI